MTRISINEGKRKTVVGGLQGLNMELLAGSQICKSTYNQTV